MAIIRPTIKGELGGRLKKFDSIYEKKPLREMPYNDVPAFVMLNRAHRNQMSGSSPPSGKRPQHEERNVQSYATEFLLLTGARTGQVLKAKWSEIEDKTVGGSSFKIWTSIEHKTRKKTKQPYIVPLNTQALEILDVMRARQRDAGIESEYASPGADRHGGQTSHGASHLLSARCRSDILEK